MNVESRTVWTPMARTSSFIYFLSCFVALTYSMHFRKLNSENIFPFFFFRLFHRCGVTHTDLFPTWSIHVCQLPKRKNQCPPLFDKKHRYPLSFQHVEFVSISFPQEALMPTDFSAGSTHTHWLPTGITRAHLFSAGSMRAHHLFQQESLCLSLFHRKYSCPPFFFFFF